MSESLIRQSIEKWKSVMPNILINMSALVILLTDMLHASSFKNVYSLLFTGALNVIAL